MTPSYEALRELVERVEAATGPDRELDRDITAALFPGEALQWPQRFEAPPEYWRRRAVENYTSSLDAITALIERTFPGCGHGYTKFRPDDDLRILGFVLLPAPTPGGYGTRTDGVAPTPALALLSALLRAKLQEKEG